MSSEHDPENDFGTEMPFIRFCYMLCVGVIVFFIGGLVLMTFGVLK